jgi:hypothetical protein
LLFVDVIDAWPERLNLRNSNGPLKQGLKWKQVLAMIPNVADMEQSQQLEEEKRLVTMALLFFFISVEFV